MVQYDAGVIQKFADNLYSRANVIVGTWTLVAGVVGGVIGYQIEKQTVLWIFTTLFGALLGAGFSQSAALKLRMMAQQALCQVEIERHVRSKG